MEIRYSEDHRLAFFNGYKFRKDMKTGYYLSSKPTDCGKRERLHCYVWRYYNGDIPAGYHVHHVDEDKEHNNIENLRCIPGSVHTSHHSRERVESEYDKICKNLIEKAVPEASKWHKSEEGRNWHRAHGFQRQIIERICEYCGKPYTTTRNGRNRFCSNNCKMAARRKSRIDDETRVCIVCGKPFRANKYSKSKTCSRTCTCHLRWDNIHKAGGEGTCLQHGSG